MKHKSARCGLFSPMTLIRRVLCPAKIAGFALLACSALASQASAALLVTGTDGGFRSASALFNVSGDTLSILLSNTSPYDVTHPDELLSSIYFRFATSSALTKTGGSVTLNGSQVFLNGTDVTSTSFGGGGDVSGEFAFKSNLTGGILGTNLFYGISANGMGGDISSDPGFDFGNSDLFSTVNLDGPTSPNGMNYGITSFGDNVGTGANEVMAEPIVKYSVLINLTGATGLTDLDLLTLLEPGNVIFQYGTSYTGPSIIIVPEPGGSVALLGLISCGLLLRSRRKTSA